MNPPTRAPQRRPSRALLRAALAAVILAAPVLSVADEATLEGKKGQFEGYVSASGPYLAIEYTGRSKVAVARLQGPAVLRIQTGQTVSFQTECVAMSDERGVSQGRCVWTGITGDRIFSEIRGDAFGGLRAINGRFVAGTGRFEGIEGDYTFQWTDFTSGDVEGTVQGHSDNVKGRYRLP
jgi:hypothetical protein